MAIDHTVLDVLDRYFDAAPRSDADAEPAGPFTLFVGTGAWSYYARPGLDLVKDISAADVTVLERHCAERGVDLAIEWISEGTPSLESAALAAGLAIERHALLTLAPADLQPVDPPVGVAVELLHGADPRLADARAVTDRVCRRGHQRGARGRR
jgi:hypothetical protein